MFLLFFLFWVLLNGKITWEILLFGLVISAAVFWFTCRFLDYSLKKERMLYRSAGILLRYLGLLILEIFKANFAVIRVVLHFGYEPEPALVTFRTDLKTRLAAVLLANAITLTPGTVTVHVTGNEFCVHALDKSMAEGIEDSRFIHLLKQLEEGLQ
ncbi:MAG: Na+/H+ antiporter subunit E [Lachnospiraceae bacterium]|nr:Na+/H+ antiporter subunit E [Lachnospiraceae bacterium]